MADTDDRGMVVEAGEVKLVVEVFPAPRPLRSPLYAAAGIGWLLHVEQSPDGVDLRLHRLIGGR